MGSDFEEITRRRYEYALGLDSRDFELHRSIFTDRITMDFSSYNGGSAQTLSADDWIAGLRPLFVGLDATQHTMTNPIVDVDVWAESARCRMYMQALHVFHDDPQPEFTIGGYYDDELVNTDDGWKITAVTLTVWWRRGNPAIMAAARERGLAQLGGA